MPIELKLTPDELQLIQHALSSLSGKYKTEYETLMKSKKSSDHIKASVKNEIYNNIWKLYIKTIQD